MVFEWIRSISDDVESRFCSSICPRNGAFCKKIAEIDKDFLFPGSITSLVFIHRDLQLLFTH